MNCASRSSTGFRVVPQWVLIALLWAAALRLPAQNALSPQDSVALLRSLATEGRIGLEKSTSPIEPRLFTTKLLDGRSVMDFLADTIGAAAGGDAAQPSVTNHWALLDEAVSITLVEAERVRALAAGGGPNATLFQTTRKNYLIGAARLLKFYKVAAGDVFDANTVAITNATLLPDWLLPGEIQIREVAGAARLNTESGEFSGRLSGKLALPTFGAMLVVPNASFDSKGRFDLSAYGAINFTGGQLSVPPRQPLHLRSTPQRGVALEGGARLTLTNGLRFDASILVADPQYCFGLSARGLEFDLGKSLLVRVPTLNLAQLNTFGDSTRDAFADYFKGLNGAMETLINAATNFPPVDETGFGQPPEFVAPEITADFSALNAWSAEVIAKTRAGLSNAQQSLQPALDSLQKINADARAATNTISDERFRLANLAARLELRRQMKEASDLAAQQAAVSGAEASQLQATLVEGARQESSNIVALITPDLPNRLGEALEVAKLLAENAAEFQQLGINPPDGNLPADPCAACTNAAASPLQRSEALALCAARRQVALYGVNPISGTITNTNVFNALDEFELYRTGRLLSDMEAALTLQGLNVQGDYTSLLGPILSQQRERLFVELGGTHALSRDFELIILLTENFNDSIQAGTFVDGNALVAQIETTTGPRLNGVKPEVIDAARAEANKNLALRKRAISDDVDQILGRRRNIGVVPPGDHYKPDFLTEMDQFFRIVGQPTPPVIGSTLDAYVRFKVQELRARPFTIDFLTNRLSDAQGIASAIIGLTDWADTRLTNDFSVLTNLQFTITNFSQSFTAAAELQKAWWLIDRYQDALRQHAAVYGANLNSGLRSAENQARGAALLASSRIAGAFSNLVANLVTHQDVLVPLPGKVEVTRISGKLCYDRSTRLLGGCFGGRVEFPEVGTNVFFDISQACLNTDGSYQIAAATALPLPIGRARLASSLNASGTPAGVGTFAGTGTLTVPNGNQGDRVFNVALSYDQTAHRVGLDAQGNNLDLRLGDDFVLFDAGFGFDISTASPSGSFRVNGSAGLLAQQHPLPAIAGRTNFYLVVDGLTTAFNFTTNAFSIALSNGTIRLPDFFHNGLCPTNPGQPATGAQLALVPSNPIAVTIGTGANPSASFSGALDFRNLGFNVPGLTNLGVEVCSMRLVFRSNAVPVLSNLNATLSIPLPQQTAVIDVNGVVWKLDGFPEAGSVALRTPLRLLDVGGVTFDFQTNTTFSFTSSLDANGHQHTKFTLTGGLQGTFNPSLLVDSQSGSAFRFGTTGTFTWETGGLPQISLGDVTFAGRMKLGGTGGFELLGVDANGIPSTNAQDLASITLTGITNLFQLSPQHPFEIKISGALGSSDFIFFGLGDAKFRFDGQPPEPEFSVASLGFRAGTQLKLLQQQNLPFQITAGSIAFINPSKPLNQLFAPNNLRFTFSGVVDISLASPDADHPTVPRLFGAVDNVQVSLPNGFSGAPQFSINTFSLALENLTIGDLAGLGGGLTVGNLNDPPNLFFAGEAAGGYNGVGIKAIVATRLDGLIGACLSVDLGPAGIPLDGGTLGGILLTGAEGGVSFLNQFADPCDFKSFLHLNSNGTPGSNAPAPAALRAGTVSSGPKVSQLQVPSWADLDRLQKLHEQNKALRASGASAALQRVSTRGALPQPAGGAAGADVSCPTGDCPPATLNLLCQRHPSVNETPSSANYNGKYANNVIFKFSSLDRKTVDDLLASANINLNGSASVVAGNFANAMTNLINGLIPRPPANLPAQQRQEINEFIGSSLVAMRGLVASAVQAALQAAAGQNRTPLEALYEAAYGGVKCVDITIQLKGTFSYAPVSVALNAKGGAVASTTGSAGILGTVNLFGLPVGTGEFFYSLTDTNGNPNPSLCGNAHVALGPLEMGGMGLAIGCDECVTGTLNALAQFINGLTGQVLTDASPIIYTFIESAAGHRINNIRSQPLTAFFGPPGPGVLLTQDEQIAVLSALLNLPQIAEFLRTHPGAVHNFGNNAVRALSEQTIQLALNIYNSTNPRLQFCGEVEPKIFGFSLTGGNTLVAASAFADKTNIRGDATFSPSYVFGNLPFYLLSGGTINNIVPALDEATMGFSLGLPVVNNSTLHLLTTNAPLFATAQVDNLLANATLTFGYELKPFGFKLADGEGRISLPTLSDHPDNPARRAAQPSRYNGSGQYLPPTSPDRSTILKAALDSNVLAQATWAGRGADLAGLFPSGSANAQAVANRELVRDYFPYGGFMGASKVLLPKPITDAPPFDQLAQIFAPPTNILQQLTVAQDVFNNYVLGSREVGQLTLYVPFPRPPALFWTLPQGPQALIDSIAKADANTLVSNLNLYPAEQLFMRGNVNAQILGLPIGQADMVADAAQGLFRLTAGVPSDSWIKSFFDAQMIFEIKSADYIKNSPPVLPSATSSNQQPDVRLQLALNQLLAAAAPNVSQAQREQALNNAVLRITDTLPKVSLDLSLNNFGIPRELTNILSANAAARFVAYSPRFNPSFVGTGPVADATRNGGVAFKGRFNFANLVTVSNAELGLTLRGAALPVLSGLFDVPSLAVPALALTNAHFAFNSDPPVGGNYIAASGSVTPIVFNNPLNNQPLLSIRNLTNVNALISANFNLARGSNNLPLPGFAISPSRIDIPMLGPGLTVKIHGATTNDPFGFSSTGPWAAQVSVSGQLSVRDLFNREIIRIGAVGTQLSAQLSGTGMQFDLFAITLPTNITIVAFPDTANQQTFSFGSGGVDNRLRISRDGTFILEGGIGGNLDLSALGFGAISAGASFTIAQNRLTITGNINGGALSNVNLPSVSGTLTVTANGISISGAASVPAFQMGVFIVSGVSGGPIAGAITNGGLFLTSGARVRVQAQGYPTNDIFTLNSFLIAGNGDFNVAATSGDINLSGFFHLTQGSYALLRSNGVASLDIFTPTLRLFEGEPHQKNFTAPFSHVFMASTGQFYADTSDRVISLPGGFTASGRLEIGYEPDTHTPEISVPTNSLNFGAINYGASTNKLLTVQNTGDAPLLVTLSPSVPAAYMITPSQLNLEEGESAQVSVRYSPDRAGPNNGTLALFHNAGAPVNIGLVATGKPVPILRLSTTNVDFGAVKRGQEVTLGVRVDNFGITNLVMNAQRLGSSQFSVTPSSATVPPGSNVLVNVTFDASAIATVNGTLRITSNDPGGTRDVPLTGTGFVVLWVDQRDGTETLYDIAINGTNRAIAVGPGDTVLWTTNKGHCWLTPENAVPPTGTFYGVAMTSNGSTGWVAGVGGAAYQTFDGGQFWSRVPSTFVTNSANSWLGVAEVPGTGRAIFVGAFHTTVLVGQTPNPVTRPVVALQTPAGFISGSLSPINTLGFQFLRRVAWGTLSGQQVGLAGLGFGPGVYRTTNGGSNWTQVIVTTNVVGPGLFVGADLAMNNAGFALLVDTFGEIFRSTDAGLNWSRVLFITNTPLYAVAMEGNVAYAGGQNGLLLRSSDNGATWTPEPIEAPTIYSIAAKSGNVWLAGERGDIQARFSQPPTGPMLHFDPGTLNYGFVPFNDSAPLALTLRNSGISPLVVTDILIAGPAAAEFAVVGLPVTIDPDEFAQVNVFFSPTNSTKVRVPYQVRSNDPDGSQFGLLRARSSSSGWVLKSPLPGSTNFTAVDVHMFTSTVGYALNSRDVFETTNGGATWAAMNVNAPGSLRCMHWLSPDLGWIGGGNSVIIGRPDSTTGFIRKTVNGGTSWTSQFVDTNQPVGNIFMVNSNVGYAVVESYRPNFFSTVPGFVLQTVNGGASWVETNSPVSTFSGVALHALSAAEVFASDDDVLYRSSSSGNLWTGVISNGGSFFRSIFFRNTANGVAVGDNGTVWRTINGGDSAAEWSSVAAFTTNNLNFVHFLTNGTGWIAPSTTADGAHIYRSDNDALTWSDELAESPYAGPANLRPTVVFGTTPTNAVALGASGFAWRYERFTNELIGIAAAQPSVNFGRSVVGFAKTANLTVRNLGDRDLAIKRVFFDGVIGTKDGFSLLTPLPIIIPRSNKTGTNSSVTIVLKSDNREVGTNEVTLTIVSDGASPTLSVALRSTVVKPPDVVVFQTDPPGMTLRVDGTNVAGPAAYTISDDDNGSGQWDFGSTHTIQATSAVTNNGQRFSFASWDPVMDQAFSLTVANGSARFTAKYLPTGETTASGGAQPASLRSRVATRVAVASGPPPGLPTGPYLRLSNASLSNSLLGGFSISGSAFLSVSNIDISLASRPVRFPAANNTPALFEVTAGSWRFSVSNNAIFQLRCQTPQVSILSNVVNPPSLVTLNFVKTTNQFQATFALPNGAPIAPGLLEIGPAAATLGFTNFFSLSVTGEVRALRKPDGSDWAFKSHVNVSLRDGPFTNTFQITNSLLRLTVPGTSPAQEFFELRGLPSGKFEVRRAPNGVFSLTLSNVVVDLLNQQAMTLSGVASSDGVFSLFAAPPPSPFEVGPFRWHATNSTYFEWNLRNGLMKFQIGGGTLTDDGSGSVPGWPADGLTLPTITFDSRGDFDYKTSLSSFTFGGITLGQADNAEDRYVRFRRHDGVLSVKLRDRHSFFGSSMKLGFDISSNGNASGFFDGTFGVDFGPGIGYMQFADTHLDYDSTRTSFQFQDQTRVLGNDFMIKFGTGGGQVCHLYCDNNGCSETVCLGNPDDDSTGVFTVSPTQATVDRNQPLSYAFTWTVPPPQDWRHLNTLQFRIRDGNRTIISILFNEADRTFSVFNPASNKFGPAAAGGSNKQLATQFAVLDMTRTRFVAAGPTSPTVTLNLGLTFKPSAAGRTYTVEVAASNDAGKTDGFAPAGELTILRVRPISSPDRRILPP